MSFQLNYQAASYLANADLSNNQQQLVILDTTTGKVRMPTASGEYAEGVLENAPLANMPATVSYQGVTKVIVDAAYAVGTALMPRYDSTSGATGLFNTGSGTLATNPATARLKMLEASAEAGDIVACRFIDGSATGIMG